LRGILHDRGLGNFLSGLLACFPDSSDDFSLFKGFRGSFLLVSGHGLNSFSSLDSLLRFLFGFLGLDLDLLLVVRSKFLASILNFDFLVLDLLLSGKTLVANIGVRNNHVFVSSLDLGFSLGSSN